MLVYGRNNITLQSNYPVIKKIYIYIYIKKEGPSGQQLGEMRQDTRVEVLLQGDQWREILRPQPGGTPGEAKAGSCSGTPVPFDKSLDPLDFHCLIRQTGTVHSCRNLHQ